MRSLGDRSRRGAVLGLRILHEDGRAKKVVALLGTRDKSQERKRDMLTLGFICCMLHVLIRGLRWYRVLDACAIGV